MHPHDSYSVLRMAFKEKAEKSDVEEYLKMLVVWQNHSLKSYILFYK